MVHPSTDTNDTMNANTIDRPAIGETNGLVDGLAYHYGRGETATVDWTTPGLRITRLRLLSDPGFPFWDVSYCHGILDGKHVNVLVPFGQLPKRGMRQALYNHAKKTGKFINGLFDSLSSLS